MPIGGHASAAEISGGVPRSDRDCFTVAARAGQRLSISQPGRTETNIVLSFTGRPGTSAEGKTASNSPAAPCPA